MLYKTMTIACSVLTAAALMMPVDGRSQPTDQGEAAHLKAGHKKVEGVVSDIKSGLFTVKTPTGSTYTLTETASIRHGHGAPKIGAPKRGEIAKGDLIARVRVEVPKKLSKKEKEAIEALKKASPGNPREALFQ